jgi:hypothetical protein
MASAYNDCSLSPNIRLFVYGTLFVLKIQDFDRLMIFWPFLKYLRIKLRKRIYLAYLDKHENVA